MKNFVIINGVNSNTINGLGINELPPISKPSMRVQQEVIDGRDGDITTNLGYSAYDKTITIGLFGTGYDINDIISFFNGEGIIVFSNEDDKYYKYKIINQIDYEALQKFKEASITFHCQPFKYPLTETPLEIEYSYIEQEGESLTLNNTGEATLDLSLKGNTSQYTTTGKNLLNPFVNYNAGYTVTTNGVTFTINDDGTIKAVGTPTADATLVLFGSWSGTTSYGTLDSAKTYKVSGGSSGGERKIFIRTKNDSTYSTYNDSSQSTITNASEIVYFAITVFLNSGTTDFTFKPMIEEGSTATDYEEYTGGIASPNPDYPQVIHTITGDNEVVVCGKNICNNAYAGNTSNLYFEFDKNLLKNNVSVSFITDATLSGNTLAVLEDNTALYNFYTVVSGSAGTRVIVNITFTNEQLETIKNATGTIRFRIYKSDAGFTTITQAQIENTSSATDYEPYQSQTYPINLGVENLFNNGNYTWDYNYGNATYNNGVYTFVPASTSSSARIQFIIPKTQFVENQQYTISAKGINKITIGYASSVSDSSHLDYFKNVSSNVATFTYTTIPTDYVCVWFWNTNSTLGTTWYLSEIQLEKGTKANSYSEYGTTPIELCKIGDYQDYFTKNNDGQWYKYNAIGKVVLDGSEASGWVYYSSVFPYRYIPDDKKYSSSWGQNLFSNYFKVQNETYDTAIYEVGQSNAIGFRYTDMASLDDFKTWLSTHNTTVYYVLATPYLSLIENETLISQLDNIQNAMSYEGTTNISQTNNDKAFIISAKALEQGSNEVAVNNIGNIYAKPLIALEGSGNVNIYLDNTQILQANVESKMNIDIAQLEAYNPDTSVLLNRQVIGNYNSMTIPSGESTIKIDGALDKATITNYTRWL